MIGRTEFKSDSKYTHFSKSYKVPEIAESHGRQLPEGTKLTVKEG